MAVAFESVGTVVGFAIRENLTLAKPAGTVAGDLLVAWIDTYTESTEAEDAIAADGWAPIPNVSWPAEWQNGVANMEGRAFYKFATGSEPSSYTFDHQSSYSEGWIVRISGADPVAPFTPTPTVNSGNAADSTFTGLTTARDGSLILLLHHDNGDTTTALSPPTGSTPTFTTRVSTTNGASVTWGATGVLTTAGATGNKTMPNNAAAGNYWTAVMVAIQPPAPPENEAPVNTAAPSITGTPQVGQTLTGTDGTWTGTPTPSLARQWQVSADGDTGWTDISGATSSPYAPVSGDIGEYVRFAVKATNTEAPSGVTAYSDPAGPILAPPPIEISILRTEGDLGGEMTETTVTFEPASGDPVSTDSGLLTSPVSRERADAGTPEHFGVMVRNNDDARAANVKAYVSRQFDNPDLQVALGVAVEAAGEPMATIPDRATAPDDVTLSSPTSAETAIDLGPIGPGEARGLWGRETVAEGAESAAASAWKIRLLVEPVED